MLFILNILFYSYRGRLIRVFNQFKQFKQYDFGEGGMDTTLINSTTGPSLLPAGLHQRPATSGKNTAVRPLAGPVTLKTGRYTCRGMTSTVARALASFESWRAVSVTR